MENPTFTIASITINPRKNQRMYISNPMSLTIYASNPISPSDATGAIPFTSGLNGAPADTENLEMGNKYITADGAIITWTGNTIIVYEPNSIPADIWSMSGSPLRIKDVTGIEQQIPIQSPNALIQMADDSGLLVGSDSVGRITKARYVTRSAIRLSVSFQDYSTMSTQFYTSDANKRKVPRGTVSEVLELENNF